jgi:uncharacterized repeat protein (TIGR03803 family)
MTLRRILALALNALVLVAVAQSQTEKVLYRFKGAPDGWGPATGLALQGGNLYGTTYFGGTYDRGTVFELRHGPAGWTEQILYSFSGGTDGGNPAGSSVIFDKKGNMYGTTWRGGNSTCDCGVIFELQPSASGWTETILSAPGSNGEVEYPQDLTFDSHGNIFGTGEGLLFELTPSAGAWKYSVVGTGGVAWSGFGELAIDSEDNIYTATSAGGNLNCPSGPCGGVLEYVAGSGRAWTYISLYEFLGEDDGGEPQSGVTLNGGNLFGTAYLTGADGVGTVYELVSANGTWTENTLHTFTNSPDGGGPQAEVAFDTAGNLYGSTAGGGSGVCFLSSNCGTVFELSPSENGWTEKILHSFGVAGHDGFRPTGDLVLDGSGNIYGVTNYGGKYDQGLGNIGYGVVYEVTP